jgi:hypothetical protein
MRGRADDMTVEPSPTRKVAADRGGNIAQNLHPLAADWAIWDEEGWTGLGLAVVMVPFVELCASTLVLVVA